MEGKFKTLPAGCRLKNSVFELQHEKKQQNDVLPAKTQISLGIRPVWSVFIEEALDPWLSSEHTAKTLTGWMPRLI